MTMIRTFQPVGQGLYCAVLAVSNGSTVPKLIKGLTTQRYGWLDISVADGNLSVRVAQRI